MPMLRDPSSKYASFPSLDLPNRVWPSRKIVQAPRWLATDLRDGNQALALPMNTEQKLRYFQLLVSLGYREIEVAYPAASPTDFDFVRCLVESPTLVPDDLWLQLMSPCREDLIRRTIQAAKGAKRAIIHIYVATSPCFQRLVLKISEQEILDLAVQCTALVRRLTKDASCPETRKTDWRLQFSPETFQDSSMDFTVKVCEAVKAAWEPTAEQQIIFNLPATVEMAMPNVFADQVEYFATHLTEREKVCVSVHTHNDRGCAVAASEMAQLAGADRIEGCLFGNGERTGNVDLVTLALNLYTQGISPGVHFNNVNEVASIVQELTRIPIHPRSPYAGSLVFCTFTGPHQDAIKKGYEERQLLGLPPDTTWTVPYLPIDPADLGRKHEAIIRVTAQSGKAGSAWIIKKALDLDLPRSLSIHLSSLVTVISDKLGRELSEEELVQIFQWQYTQCTPTEPPVPVPGKHSLRSGPSGEDHLLCDIRDYVQQVGLPLLIEEVALQWMSDKTSFAAYVAAHSQRAPGVVLWGVSIHKTVENAISSVLQCIMGQMLGCCRPRGLSAATALRRAGHKVTIYERSDYANDAGSSISTGANGSRWLNGWGVNLDIGKPVIIEQLIWHELRTGKVQSTYDLSDYSARWKYPLYNFYRPDLHAMLMDAATGSGPGRPATLKLNYVCESVDCDKGTIAFSSQHIASHDLIIGADGIASTVRHSLGIFPDKRPASSTSYHCILPTANIRRLGLMDMSDNKALEYWGGHSTKKIVFVPCRNGEIQSFYTFFPTSQTLNYDNSVEGGLNFSISRKQLLHPFPELEPNLRELLSHAVDIKPWRLYVHKPYAYWQRARLCLLGDAAHPMLPDQSQGACQAIEDAAALGIIFGPGYSFTKNVGAGLELYERIRKPRASRVQAASARARENLSERIGFSSQKKSHLYQVADECQKLTIEEINEYDLHQHIAAEAPPAYHVLQLAEKWASPCVESKQEPMMGENLL
ncbi:hypothetical protein CNMCM5623_002228 [Aspergillus felis]|uniref:2-isopropylmalate synthase n=1 Tax=Aspergillus felis TaxID=1287682 RepID=A0A8H6QAN5_9EURO|nr:hypothetical protein CNMCM5623_002228 [Aspergillus felis]